MDEDREGDPPAAVVDPFVALHNEIRGYDERLAAGQRLIDKLHEENDRLRAGERQLLLRPVQIDLQRLRNDLIKQAATLPADLTPQGAADLLLSFAVTVELALERCGVQVVRPLVGGSFDAATHRAVAAIPAPSAEQDATIAAALADGYLDTVTQRVLTPASVQVYRFVPTQENPAEESPCPPTP